MTAPNRPIYRAYELLQPMPAGKTTIEDIRRRLVGMSPEEVEKWILGLIHCLADWEAVADAAEAREQRFPTE